MSTHMENPQESLQGLAQGNLAMDAWQNLIAVSFEESGLDPQTFMLVRMAALATLDAAPASWLMNITVGGEAGLAPEQLGTLIALAPVICTARVVSAQASNILKAFALAGELAEAENNE
jgi:4-carboxymuconolactone decarboxylase